MARHDTVTQPEASPYWREIAGEHLRTKSPGPLRRYVAVQSYMPKWDFPKIRGTLFGVLIIRILLFRVLY